MTVEECKALLRREGFDVDLMERVGEILDRYEKEQATAPPEKPAEPAPGASPSAPGDTESREPS
jgi:hypothetical protein